MNIRKDQINYQQQQNVENKNPSTVENFHSFIHWISCLSHLIEVQVTEKPNSNQQQNEKTPIAATTVQYGNCKRIQANTLITHTHRFNDECGCAFCVGRSVLSCDSWTECASVRSDQPNGTVRIVYELVQHLSLPWQLLLYHKHSGKNKTKTINKNNNNNRNSFGDTN